MSDVPVIDPEGRGEGRRGQRERDQPEREQLGRGRPEHSQRGHDQRGRDQDERGRRPRPLLRTSLGQVLRRARLKQGRTLADVARAAQVSMPYLSEIERGRKEASSEVLAAVCDSLRIELPDVLAQVRSDLEAARPRRAQVLQLESFRARQAQARPQRPSSGDVTMLAAA
ncbi:helix-turn-helix domain-containing protein [Phytoactinopolyspora halotolerans]|uniref:Helix-turn-helix domain-containing protein n=1 Tax=Phytoactinopolyspora halotolerans TaxID=1981512 RepID=A0A6L9SBZ4_9ACTN|nr:helix-turn-helix domain-containing protein [Phytoactinopolyspora halotolerans]NEE02058.1 helix-turn-helix domain-containing protein [Phytoactinopolyspora halotolerans]